MHKNRVIIILGIFIMFVAGAGFIPETKTYLIQAFAALIVILAFLIEKKGVFALDWRKRSPTTPVASTYIEHNGTTAPATTQTVNPSPVAESEKPKV